ncbi:hypothetical protein [Chryseobacterium sp.]|uniref:hypothetical protein n=1 Tax=Chryseobacterium sp. TaxID=1871047 RepID=UPI00333F661B
MKRISINLYSIDELSNEVQKLVFEKYRSFNVENDNWYESTFYDFTALCKSFGIVIDRDRISFRGFSSQGDGSTFESSVDEIKFISRANSQGWKEYAPLLEFNFEEFPCDKRVTRLIEKGAIECKCSTKVPTKGYWIDITVDFQLKSPRKAEFKNINKELAELEHWLEDCLNVLNNHLYKSLAEEYEYLTSDVILRETFSANNYVFTEDGTLANGLLKLSQQ